MRTGQYFITYHTPFTPCQHSNLWTTQITVLVELPSSPFSGTTLSWASSSSKSCCHKIHFFKSTVHSDLQNHWQWHANECDFVSMCMCTYTWTWLCLHISLYAFVCSCTSYARLLLDVSTTSTGTWILGTLWGDSQPEIDAEREETARDRNWDRNRQRQLDWQTQSKAFNVLYTNLWLHSPFQPLKLHTVGVCILLLPLHVL